MYCKKSAYANTVIRKPETYPETKKQVWIVCALIKSPHGILFDEPTGNLDKSSSKEVLDLLKECSKKILAVIVPHNLFDAYGYADSILSLDKGKIVDDRTISEKELSGKTIVLQEQAFLDETFAPPWIQTSRKEKSAVSYRKRTAIFRHVPVI